METKKRRVRWNTKSYSEEVRKRFKGEYEVLGKYVRSTEKIEVRHTNCGHKYKVRASNLLSGDGCPACSEGKRKKKSNLEFIAEIKELVGDEYSFLDTYFNYDTKLTVKHNRCGNIYMTSPDAFIRQGVRCRNCREKDQRVRFGKSDEQFKKEVFELVGNEYTFLEKYRNAMYKLQVYHSNCEKTYSVRPKDFLYGYRCPHCSDGGSRVALSQEDFERRVFDLTGGDYEVLGEYVNIEKKIQLLHVSCGHMWEVRPTGFLHSGNRCPKCRYSRGEKSVAEVLESLSVEYEREFAFKSLGRKRYDFFIPSLNIAIEYDGEQHFKPVRYWGGGDYFESVRQSDALKNDFCEYMGIDLLRIPYWEFDNIDEIVTNFIDTVKLMRSISDRKEA